MDSISTTSPVLRGAVESECQTHWQLVHFKPFPGGRARHVPSLSAEHSECAHFFTSDHNTRADTCMATWAFFCRNHPPRRFEMGVGRTTSRERKEGSEEMAKLISDVSFVTRTAEWTKKSSKRSSGVGRRRSMLRFRSTKGFLTARSARRLFVQIVLHAEKPSVFRLRALVVAGKITIQPYPSSPPNQLLPSATYLAVPVKL